MIGAGFRQVWDRLLHPIVRRELLDEDRSSAHARHDGDGASGGYACDGGPARSVYGRSHPDGPRGAR